MKQGRATTSIVGSTKTEPVSKAVSPAAAGRIGLQHGNHADTGTVRLQSIPMYEGRGLQAPMKKTTAYPKGSQR